MTRREAGASRVARRRPEMARAGEWIKVDWLGIETIRMGIFFLERRPTNDE